jgi:hypothetical protein
MPPSGKNDNSCDLSLFHFNAHTNSLIFCNLGPCGGKTTGQARLCTFFENLGWKVNDRQIVKSLSCEIMKINLSLTYTGLSRSRDSNSSAEVRFEE